VPFGCRATGRLLVPQHHRVMRVPRAGAADPARRYGLGADRRLGRSTRRAACEGAAPGSAGQPSGTQRWSIDRGYFDFGKINLNIFKLVPKSGPRCDGFGDDLPRGPFLPTFRTLIPSGLPIHLNASDKPAKLRQAFRYKPLPPLLGRLPDPWPVWQPP
jgi:hypothetical protein